MTKTALIIASLLLSATANAGEYPANKTQSKYYESSSRHANYEAIGFKELRRLAESGDADAQYVFAHNYERGIGTTQNFFRAYIWYSLAASQGHPSAYQARDEIGEQLPRRALRRAQRTAQQILADYRDEWRSYAHSSTVVQKPTSHRSQVQASTHNIPADPMIISIQRSLHDLGYNPGPVDGRNGPRTQLAIRIYQRDHRLLADGLISKTLLQHLRASLANEQQHIATQPQQHQILDTDRRNRYIHANEQQQQRHHTQDTSRRNSYGHSLDTDSIRLIQRALYSLGYNPGPIDGVFGSRTRSAIRAYQQAHQLTQTGQPTTALMDHLQEQLQTALNTNQARYSSNPVQESVPTDHRAHQIAN